MACSLDTKYVTYAAVWEVWIAQVAYWCQPTFSLYCARDMVEYLRSGARLLRLDQRLRCKSRYDRPALPDHPESRYRRGRRRHDLRASGHVPRIGDGGQIG